MTTVQPPRPPPLSSHSTSDATALGHKLPPSSRPRSSTLQVSTSPSYASIGLVYPASADVGRTPADIFDSLVEEDGLVTASLKDATSPKSPLAESLDDLPIEIRSLTERFLHSLTTKTYPSPLGIDAIAELYQDFYQQAESHIATHIAARASLLSRASTSQSTSPVKDAPSSRLTSRKSSTDDTQPTGEQQMLTAAEIADKKRARRHLQLQKEKLDEAVERIVCEKLYDRIYRHRSGDDEERDAKLRSKTAALNLLGIGLKELHVNIQTSKLADAPDAADIINQHLAPARESIRRMDDEHHPHGKLQHLKAAHKGIVETLAHLFPASSSADEVLPTLIYTLVTSLPETLNVVSNLHFVQLFRAASRLDGETAYCLVNLEAAVAFLETVDLSSLDTDRSIDQPSKPSDALTLHTGENPLMASSESLPLPPSEPIPQVMSVTGTITPAAPPAGQAGHQRRLSSIIQNQKVKLEAGRESLANTADQALESINTTLDNSIKFLFGRMQQEADSPAHKSPVTMPRTLDEARQLVSTPSQDPCLPPSTPGPQVPEKDQQIKASVTPSSDPLRMSDTKLMDVFGGKRTRDRSADSRASTGSSNKHVSFATKDAHNEGVGSFVNSLNPLSRFSVPSFPRFGRSTSGPTPQTTSLDAKTESKTGEKPEGTDAKSEVDLNAVETLAQLRSAPPPEQRFLDVSDASELRIGDVQALLWEYQRLASVIRHATL